jgi:signal transduction histidine kinase
MSDNMNPEFKEDVNAVQRIPIIDELLDIICSTTGMGYAAVARVTEDHWVACAVADKINFGLGPGGELKVETTLCHEVRQFQKTIAFDDAHTDETYAKHHTPEIYGLRSYISVPIILKNGKFFGTLCAIDPKPALLNNRETIAMFTFYADLLSFHLHAVEQIADSELKLKEEKEIAELREQFIAILGHDLRNPVGAVHNVAQLMLRMPLDERMTKLATILKDSSFRMRELIENMLDFASGKLGNGIVLQKQEDVQIENLIRQVAAELELVWPDRPVEIKFDLDHPLSADGKRIGQLFSNLLGNAFSYGDKEQPIAVDVKSDRGEFSLIISNAGEKIPEALIKNLFKPFSRGEVKPEQGGLGLGLYISSEIARAHGGTLNVTSNDERTSFIIKLPVTID